MVEVHAHKILNMLKQSPMTKIELNQAVIAAYGDQVRFCTCKLSGFDFETLLEFFIEREKVVVQQGLLMVNSERICNHS